MPPYVVPAVGSAIKVLGELAQCDGLGATHTELVQTTGISKSTMHNLLGTLELGGYVRRSSSTRRYHLGGALIPLGAAAAREVQMVGLAIERLPALAAQFALSLYVAQVISNGEAQIIGRAYPPQPMHVGMRTGTRFGYFDGAIGKCLLATIPPAEAAEIVRSHPIPVHTALTVTDPDALEREVEVVRERGWAASIGEYNNNGAIAAPMIGPDGAEGVLVAVGFTNDFSADDVPRLGTALHKEASAIAAQVGVPTDTTRQMAGANSHEPQKGAG